MRHASLRRPLRAVKDGPALRSRQHPLYQQVFPILPSELSRSRRYDQPEAVQQLAARLEATDDFDGKAAALTNLQAALERSFAARDALDAAEMAGDRELSARLALRTRLEQVYGTLRSVFPGQRDFVESFFLIKEREEKAEVGTTPSSEPAP